MKIQRKLKRKNTNRKTHVKQNPSGLRSKTESQNELINPADLPPHILDKIPPGLSMKPNAATIRQIAMQQMTRNMMPLPFNLTPQQQQVQNMRSNNDLKENAINQAKQDMINENERKRELQRQEAETKREHQQRKHNLDAERQQFDQEQKLKEQKHKLKREKEDLEFQKLLLDRDNTIREQRIKNDEQLDLIRMAKLRGEELKAQAEENDLKRQFKDLEYQKDLIESNNNISEQRIKNEEQLALIQQMKYENEKLKSKLARNDLNNRFKQYQSQYNDIKTENEALKVTLDKINSEDFQAKFNTLVDNLSEARASNRVLNMLTEERKKLLDEEMMRKIEPTEEMMKAMYSQTKKDIEGLQASLAEQSNDKQKKMDEMDRFNNLRKYKQNLVLKNDNLKNDLYELNERIKGSGVDEEELKNSISEKVKTEALLNTENQVYEQHQENERLTKELITQQEKRKIISSEEYKDKQKALAALIESNERKKKDIAFINESVEALTEADNLKFESQIKAIVRDAKHEDESVHEALRGLYDTELNAQSLSVLSKQMAAQYQLKNQEDEDKYKYVNEFQKIKDSLVIKTQDYFKEFTDQNGTEPKEFMTWLNKDASGADAKEYWNRYQEFLAQKENEAKTKKENEANEQKEDEDEDVFLA